MTKQTDTFWLDRMKAIPASPVQGKCCCQLYMVGVTGTCNPCYIVGSHIYPNEINYSLERIYIKKKYEDPSEISRNLIDEWQRIFEVYLK